MNFYIILVLVSKFFETFNFILSQDYLKSKVQIKRNYSSRKYLEVLYSKVLFIKFYFIKKILYQALK